MCWILFEHVHGIDNQIYSTFLQLSAEWPSAAIRR